jgi:hypothetical protein
MTKTSLISGIQDLLTLQNFWTLAKTLQCTIFFYCCRFFGLQGHDEHHSLECNQFFVDEDKLGKYIGFPGRSAHTFKGGLAQIEVREEQIRPFLLRPRAGRF